ncbi:MAG: alpha/beta hydrolase-fold protein [Gaiellales bacterium]
MQSIPASLARFSTIGHGARRGLLLEGSVPGVGEASVYLPSAAASRRGLRVVYVDSRKLAASTYADSVNLASLGDQLIWDGTTPPFVAVVAHTAGPAERTRLEAWAVKGLPIARGRHDRTVLSVPSRTHASLAGRLTRALQSRAARRSSAAAWAVAPVGFSPLLSGPDGGTIWSGPIRDSAVPTLERQSLVYLPPNVSRARRYPLVILLHGLRGSPYSFAGGLRLAAAADPLIGSRQVRPFIAVMPPAGLTPSFDGEWTGPWERYVVADVIPWASAHLPVERDAAGRVIAGFSAGGYGAVDIALRHPGTFGVAESWSGYFDAPRDGSLRHAAPAERAAHTPALLLARDRTQVRASGLRILVSAGRGEQVVLRATRRFGGELAALGLPSRVLVMPGAHDGKQWNALLGPALRYALPVRG